MIYNFSIIAIKGNCYNIIAFQFYQRKRVYILFIIIKKLSPEEKQLKIIEKNNEMFSLIKKEKGVKNIIEKIIECEKPIVGHNCFIDLL